jgi:hypothetical protein
MPNTVAIRLRRGDFFRLGVATDSCRRHKIVENTSYDDARLSGLVSVEAKMRRNQRVFGHFGRGDEKWGFARY